MEEQDNAERLISFWHNFSGVIQDNTHRSADAVTCPTLFDRILLKKLYWAHPAFPFLRYAHPQECCIEKVEMEYN